MPFTPKDWQDTPSTATPISAAALEDLETRVANHAEAHIVDTTAAHAASAIQVTPSGTLTQTDAQSALVAQASGLDAHVVDTSAAHQASAIASQAVPGVSSLNVQSAIAELGSGTTSPTQITYFNNGAESLSGTRTLPVTGVRNGFFGGTLAGNLIINITGDLADATEIWVRLQQAQSGSGPFTVTFQVNGLTSGVSFVGGTPAPVLSTSAGVVQKYFVFGAPDARAEITKEAGTITYVVTPPPPPAVYNDVIDVDSPVFHAKLGNVTGGPYTSRVGPTSASVAGTPTKVTGLVANNSTDGATQFDTVSADILYNDAAVFDRLDTFTLEAWVKRDAGSLGGSRSIMSKQANAYSLSFNTSNFVLLRKSGVQDIVVSNLAITDTTDPHHIVCTKNGASSIKIYIDGVDRTGTVTNINCEDNASSFKIGSFSGMRVDEVAIYSTVLSAARVQAHYQAGVGAATGDELTFTADNTTDFPNPERGFYTNRGNITFASGGDSIIDTRNQAGRKANITLIRGVFRLDAYRTTFDLPQAYLNGIIQWMLDCRTLKIKTIPTPMYAFGSSTNNDATQAITVRHIQQMGPIFNQYKDCIAFIEMGYVGNWGEWHQSDHDDVGQGTEHIDNSPWTRTLTSSGQAIYNAAMQNFPSDRQLSFRHPLIKRDKYGFNSPLTATEAFTTSDKARHAHYNLSMSANQDWGTGLVTHVTTTDTALASYAPQLQDTRNYLRAECKYTVFSFEVEGYLSGATRTYNSTFQSPAKIKADALEVRADMGDADYNNVVWNNAAWTDPDWFEFKRNLGYRYQLTAATVPPTADVGSTVPLTWTIANVGYGKLVNPRPVQVVLKNNSTSAITRITTTIDPRRWYSQETTNVSTSVSLPLAVVAGTYAVGLALPDPSSFRSADPLEAIRFANTGVWNATDGVNYLGANIVVS